MASLVVGYEMKPECCETYRANLHSECRNEMLTEETEYPQADVIRGGPPCQPFSRRGKRKGKDDARDGFPACIAAIRKVQPKIWVCENVKGLPELDEKYFKSILEHVRSIPQSRPRRWPFSQRRLHDYFQTTTANSRSRVVRQSQHMQFDETAIQGKANESS